MNSPYLQWASHTHAHSPWYFTQLPTEIEFRATFLEGNGVMERLQREPRLLRHIFTWRSRDADYSTIEQPRLVSAKRCSACIFPCVLWSIWHVDLKEYCSITYIGIISGCKFRKEETSKWVVLEPIRASNTFVPSILEVFARSFAHWWNRNSMESSFGETIPRRARMKICNFRRCSFH